METEGRPVGRRLGDGGWVGSGELLFRGDRVSVLHDGQILEVVAQQCERT